MIAKRDLKRWLLSSPKAIRESVVVLWFFRVKELIEAKFGRGNKDDFVPPDGLPMPPARLRVAISGIADGENHWRGGIVSKVAIEDILKEQDVTVGDFDSLLDFGSGAGRVLRQWADLDGVSLRGCDYNADAIEWAQANFPFADCSVNGLEPPLPYEDDSFDFVYVLSVFTHFSEELQPRWMAELARVIRPGGWLIFTTMGLSFRGQLTDDQQVQFDEEGFVVHFPGSAGSNLCSAYHSPAFARELAGRSGFEAVTSREAGPDSLYPQDMHLVRLSA